MENLQNHFINSFISYENDDVDQHHQTKQTEK